MPLPWELAVAGAVELAVAGGERPEELSAAALSGHPGIERTVVPHTDPAAYTAPPSRAAAPSPRCPVQPPLLCPGDAGAGCNSEDEREREKEPEERIELLLDVESTTALSALESTGISLPSRQL